MAKARTRNKMGEIKQTVYMLEILKSYRKQFPTANPVYLKYLEGQPLTMKQSIIAKCFDCCNGFKDGKIDCQMPQCPLYPYMPYRKGAEDGEL